MCDGVHIRLFPNLSNRLAYQFQLFLPVGFGDYLARHAAAFDVAHVHACRNLPGVIAARHFGKAGVPYVLAPNGTAPIIERRRAAKRAFDAIAGDQVVARASKVLAVSNAERRQLCSLGIGESSIRLIPNPIDGPEPAAVRSRGAFRRKHGLAAHPVVLFLGQLTPRKRVDVLVRAVARLRNPDVRLVIAGNDRGAGHDVRSAVRRLGLSSRTLFTGLLCAAERLEALADADVVVYASEHEVFGLVPLEALSTGTPVVVADDSGCGEIVRVIGGGQLVPVGDEQALADAIALVLASPDDWRSAAQQAAVRARAAFGEEKVCAQVEELYAELIIGSSRHAR
jgi:glycosyltransferase involved in cell wall biosynthesis